MKKLLYLLVVVLLTSLTFTACQKDQDDPEELSPTQKEVQKLLESGGYLQLAENSEYIETSDTVYGSPTNQYNPITDQMEFGRTVKTKQHYSIVDNPEEFVTFNPWSGIYPGALIQGGSLRDGVPSTIPIYNKRQPGRIFLYGVTGNEEADEWYREIDMRGSEAIQAMNELLTPHLGKAVSVQTSFEFDQIQSIEQLAHKAEVNLKFWKMKLSSTFGTSFDENKSYVAVHLTQAFFTFSCDDLNGVDGTFTDDILPSDLAPYTGPGNPICYVSSITYGRKFILVYESSESASVLETALRSAYGSNNSADYDYNKQKVVNQSKCTMVQLGGDPVAGLETVFGDYEKIQKFVIDGGVISENNVGAPLSYVIKHLADSSPAKMSNTMEYTFTSQEFYPSESNNDVILDFLNVKADIPTSSRKVSNHSKIKISEITVRAGRPTNPDSLTIKLKAGVDFPSGRYDVNKGASIPVYNTVVLKKLPEDCRIRITFVPEVYHQTYGGPTHKATITDPLDQMLEYDKENGKWVPLNEEGDIENKAFASLNGTARGASMKTEFRLNYVFTCDGRKYTYQYDGTGY